jgi:RNA polymerase sigma-70 factor (ECF subfamily)
MESLKEGLTKSSSSPESPEWDGRDVAETVARVLGGDREAFRSLVEGHYRAVLGLSRRLLGSRPSEAEDVAQETFLNAYRYLHTLQDPRRFSSWLFQIARSACRERRRRWSAEERVLRERVEWLRRGAHGVHGEAGHGGDGDVAGALAELPREEREALSLRYFEGLSYEEIAARLELSFSQVDHLIRKARARVARRLAVRQRVESL